MVVEASVETLEFDIAKLSFGVLSIELIIARGKYGFEFHPNVGVELSETAHLWIVDEHVQLEAADISGLHCLPHNGLHSPVSLNSLAGCVILFVQLQ